MTPPLFLVADLGSADVLVLTGPEAHHAGTVRRLVPGEDVLLADGHGGLAEAVVEQVGRDRVSLRVRSRSRLPEPSPRLVVAQALPKGERAELAVELLTELGVDEIVPWAAARSISLWKGERADKGVAKWQRTALAASKQSRRPRIPTVTELAGSAELADRIVPGVLALVLHEEAAVGLAGSLDGSVSNLAELLVIVGPEGGVSPDELALFTGRGARPVRLGPEVLRTSTAGAAALAILSVSVGRWR
ncbi:MAG TPA: 16S rRNA (uracil(1498)-N(3))-methyltransferase [Jatrophihabitans sp.]|nr:16S rRNA (uracil(1498)-N(3))-methyltransferase [Jatrophihabitans sp.]